MGQPTQKQIPDWAIPVDEQPPKGKTKIPDWATPVIEKKNLGKTIAPDLQTSSKTTPSVVETPYISEKEIPQVDLDQLQIPADNPVGDAEYVKFLDKQTKQKPTSIGMGGVASGGNDNSIPDANAIVYANKIRKKYKDNGIDLDQVSQELEGLPKGIEDVTITNADGSTRRPYSGETLSKERATDYLSYKNKVNALKNVYGIKLSKDPDKENKANLYSELQHTNLTGDLVTDVDRVNNNKNRQIDIIRSSTDDQEEQAKMINRVDENKVIWVEQNVPTPDLAKKYLDDKLTRLGVVMPSKNQKVYANDATFNGNVDNYSLEDIQKHLDPNNLIEQRIFDKYKNNKQLTDVISNSTSLDDAAIQFAAKQNPKIQAAMDVFGGDLPENLKGNLVEAFLNNDDVIRLSKTDPKIASLYEKTKNSMATKYPEWETNKVAQVISQYREDNDMNNWFANVPTLDGTDKVVEQLVKDGKLTDFDKNIYESKIRPQIGVLQSVKRGVVGIPLGAVVGYESPIKTPGLLENALTGYNKSIHNAARSVEDFASYTNPSSNPTQKIDDANKLWNITQENNNIQSLIPKSKLHEISETTGNLTGSIVPLIAGGALLSGVKGGDLINMALNFEGGNREKALTEFPNDPAKRYLYTALGTGIDMTLAQLIPIEKIGSGATKLFKNDIKGVINDLSNGTISNAVAKKTLLEKAATYFPELVKENAKTAGVMTGFGVFHNILDSVFGNNNMSSDDIAKDAVKQYKSTFLATPLLSALSVFGKNNKVNGKVLWDIGGNGDMYRKMLDEKLKANPDSQEVKDQLENLKNVVGVRKDLENVRIPEERKQKYLILSLNEDIWNRKASETKDELIKQKYLDKAEKFKSEKEAVYNNKDKAEEFKQYDNVEPETPSTPKEELPIEKTNTGTEVEPNLGEGRKPVTLSGNTEEERQVAIERRKKETKQTPMTGDRDKLLERINNYNSLPKIEKRKSTEANNIKIAIDNFNKTHDQKYSVSANRDGSLDLRNNKDRRMKYSPSGNEGSIVENSKPLIERDENTQKVFNDLLDNDVLPSARRVNGEKMSESEHDATIQDIMDGIPSQRAENYLNSLEKQIKNDDFDYGNPDKNARVTLKDALGITEEHGEPLPVEKVKEWLNTESELTPEDETTLDNIENLLTHYEQRHELPEGGISPKVQQPTQEGTGTISKPIEPNKPKEEVSNQANTETITLDNNGNEVPPINKVEEVGNNGNDGNWEAIRKAKQVEIDKVKEAYEKQPVKTWSETMNNGLTKASKMFPEKNLYDATTSLMRQMKLGGGTGDLTPDEAVAAMHYLKMETNSKRSALADRVLESDDSIVRDVAALEDSLLKEQYDDAALEAKKITTQAGRTLNYAQAEIMNSPENGLKIRRMELTKAKGSPLTETENAWAKEQFDKQLELQKRENEVMAQKMQDTFDEKIAELKKEHEAALKNQNPTTPKARQKKSEKLKDLAKRIRTENELDKFNQSANGGIVKSSMFGDVDFKELAAQAVEYIAKAVEAGEDISKAISESAKKFKGKFDESEFGKNIAFLITKAELPTKEEATNKIREYIKKSGDTDVTNEMVGKNLIRDYINSHIGDVEQNDLLNKAFNDLKKELPNLTKEKLIEAYLKENEFKQPTKKQLEGGIREQETKLKKIAKDELTTDQEQKRRLQQDKENAINKTKEFKRKLDEGEFEEPNPPTKLKKQDAELIRLKKQQSIVEELYRKKQRELQEKNKHWAERVADTIRSAYVALLIGAPKTLAKVASMSIMRPVSEATSKLTFGKVFDKFFPGISKAAKLGGESSSIKSVQKGFEAYFRQMGSSNLELKYNEASKEYSDAVDTYENYKKSGGTDNKKLEQLRNNINDKLLKVQGSFIYKFIGGSSLKDALKALVNRSNEIERQFGKVEGESIKDGNWLDKANYVMGFIGRSHSAAKTFSGRFSFAAGFMARLEGAVESGVDITSADKILEIAHESYLDWERGKYQQYNDVTNLWNKMTNSLEKGEEGSAKKTAKVMSSLLKTEVAITRVPVNILHEQVMEYTLGAFTSLYRASKVSKEVKQQLKDAGISIDAVGKEEFKKALKEKVSQMDEKQAATIARCFRKGGLGVGLYAFALISGAIHFGIFPHLGQKKEKDESELKDGELNPDEVVIGNTHFGKVMSGIISHIPAFYPTGMGLGMAQAYNDEIDKGKTTKEAVEKSLYTHLKIVEGGIPQFKLVAPLQEESVRIAKKRMEETGILSNPIGITDSESDEYKFLKDHKERIMPYAKNQLKPITESGKPIDVSDDDYNKFMEVRERLIKADIKDLMDGKKNFRNGEEQDIEDKEGNTISVPKWGRAAKEIVETITPKQLSSFLMTATNRADEKAIQEVFHGKQTKKAKEDRVFE